DQRTGAGTRRGLSLAGRRSGLLLSSSDFFDEPDVGADLLEHAVLERAAPGDRLGLAEGRLRLLRFSRGQVGHPQVMEGRRLRGPLTRTPQTVDGPVELAPLVVHPAQRRQRVGLQLVGSLRERPARVVEGRIEVVLSFREGRRELVVRNRPRGLRRMLLEEVAREADSLLRPPLRPERLGKRRARGRRHDVLRLAGEDLPAGGDRLLPEAERGGDEREGDPDRRVARLLRESLAVELVGAVERAARDLLFGFVVRGGARTVHPRPRIAAAALPQPHHPPALQPPAAFFPRLRATLPP